jgi:hypothetical protein
MTKRVMRVTTPTPPFVTPEGIALSVSEKAEVLTDSLEVQFQPVTNPLGPAVIETVEVHLQENSQEPTNELMLTDCADVQEAIVVFKINKASGPDGIPNRALKHLPQIVILLLHAWYFPPVWKHARIISILERGKDPVQPSSYRPISLLHTIGKVSVKNLLSKILSEVSGLGLLRDEKFCFRPKHCTSLQLARLVERVSRNLGERRPTKAVLLDVSKAFDILWFDGLAYKLMAHRFPSYPVKTMQFYLRSRTFEASIQAATSSRRCMRAGVAQGRLISPPFPSSACMSITYPSPPTKPN